MGEKRKPAAAYLFFWDCDTIIYMYNITKDLVENPTPLSFHKYMSLNIYIFYFSPRPFVTLI